MPFCLAINLNVKWKWKLYGQSLFAEEAPTESFVIVDAREPDPNPSGPFWNTLENTFHSILKPITRQLMKERVTSTRK